MKPFQQFSFFITRGVATANGLAEFPAVGNSCHKDCPRVRVSWYSSSLPWSHRNPSPSDAAESQKKPSASLLMGLSGQSGFHPKKARSTEAQTAKPWESCPGPHSKFPDSSVLLADRKLRDETFKFQGATTEAEASEFGLWSSVLFQSSLNELTTLDRFFFSC